MHLLLPNQFIFVTSLVVWLSNHDSSQHWGQILLKFTFNSLTFKISWKPRYLCILLMHLIQHPILKTKIRTFKNFLTNYNMVYKSCLFIWYCKIYFNWSKSSWKFACIEKSVPLCEIFFVWLRNEALGLDLRFAKMLIYITFKTVSFVFWPCN